MIRGDISHFLTLLYAVKYWWFQVGKVIRRIASFFDTTILYFSKFGLKSINAKIDFGDLSKLKKKQLSSNELFLFVDGLIDSETLVGKNIKDSPHFQLISTLDSQKLIDNCEYITRAQDGRLDMRGGTFYDTKFYLEKFQTLKNDFELNKVTPLLVFPLDERYFILDGKHRAAYFALKEKPIEAYIVMSIKNQPFLNRVWKKIHSNNSANFSKNISLLEKVL